jgi:hypothetical protein
MSASRQIEKERADAYVRPSHHPYADERSPAHRKDHNQIENLDELGACKKKWLYPPPLSFDIMPLISPTRRQYNIKS